MDIERRQRAFDAVDRATELPLLLLALAMIPLIAGPLVFNLPDNIEEAFLLADWTIWAVFALELTVKTYLAPARLKYVRRHWFDVIIVAIPFLRPLRVVRSARALRLLRALRLVSFGLRTLDTTRVILTRNGLQYVLLTTGVLIVASAAAVTILESGNESTIDNFGAGLWWAFVTVTTVGYGDTFPITAAGRGVAVFLMLLGISTFGLVTANVASFLLKPDEETVKLEDVVEQLQRIEAKLDAIAEDHS